MYKNSSFLFVVIILLITPTIQSQSWEIFQAPEPGNNGTIQDIVALSDEDIWVVGFFHDPLVTNHLDYTYAMHYNGSEWEIHTLPQFGYANDNLYSVTATSANDVWAVGSYDDNLRRRFPLLLHWDGSTWSKVDLGNAAGQLFSIEVIGENDIWAVGEGVGPGAPDPNVTNLVIHYNGTDWEGVDIPSPGGRTNRLTDVNGSSSNDVWLVGYYRNSGSLFTSVIFHWDGNTWTLEDNPNPPFQNFLYATISTRPDNMYAIGRNDAQSLVQHWNGTGWEIFNLPGISKFDMDYADENHIWGTGYDIVMWNGQEWVAETLPGVTNMNLRGVDVVHSGSVWAAGGSDEIPYLVAHRTEATSVSNDLTNPIDFILEQNYPNPFNPSTKIKYAIGSRQYASLKVYDVLGNEVATLVDEEKEVGIYEVNFNASELTSGVYFYKLQAGSIVQTKKMILLR